MTSIVSVWVTEDCIVNQPDIFNLPNCNLVICGRVLADTHLTIKVHNLVVLGKLICPFGATLVTKLDLFCAGKLYFCGKKVQFSIGRNMSMQGGADYASIKKEIAHLGVYGKRLSSGQWRSTESVAWILKINHAPQKKEMHSHPNMKLEYVVEMLRKYHIKKAALKRVRGFRQGTIFMRPTHLGPHLVPVNFVSGRQEMRWSKIEKLAQQNPGIPLTF